MVDWGALLTQYDWLLANQYVQALLFIVLTLAVAKLFQGVCVHCFRKITEKTETDVDDIILKLSARPLFYLIFIIGLYFALRPLVFFVRNPTILKNIFFVVGMIVVAWMIARVFAFLITRWFKSHRGLSGTPKLLNLILGIVVYVAALIIILSYFNIEFTPLIAALGVGGLAVGLALQDTLSNIFAGIHIISDEPIRINDFVELEGNKSGVVKDIGWRSTRIQTFAGNTVVFPNAKLANSVITNVNVPHPRTKTTVLCGVDYGSDLARVEKVALEVATKAQKNVEGAIADFEPIFRYHTFGDSNIDFKVILEAKTRGDKFLLAHEFMKMLHARFEKEKIEISWPVRKMYSLKPGKPKKAKVAKTSRKKTVKKRRGAMEDLDIED